MDSTPQHRHQCEVRAVLRWRVLEGSAWVASWLAGVEKTRGQAAADRLRDDARSQWAKGSRGEPGVWL
jgi:hypothetical protein